MFWLVLIGYILPSLIVIDGIQATVKVLKSEGEKIYLGHCLIAIFIAIFPVANIFGVFLLIFLLSDEEDAVEDLKKYSYILKFFYKEI